MASEMATVAVGALLVLIGVALNLMAAWHMRENNRMLDRMNATLKIVLDQLNEQGPLAEERDGP